MPKDNNSNSNIIVKFILDLLAPGANNVSLIILDITVLLMWCCDFVCMMGGYHNIHIYILTFLTTGLAIFVNLISGKINNAIEIAEEEKKNEKKEN
ncbi:hypothetical protein WA158_004331 [Blastocystis sp. Blastoise]